MLPRPLFNDGFSTVVFDRNGMLLGAKVAPDQQWRFQGDTILPYKFEKAILNYEDKYFYYHPGINIFSIVTSIRDNLSAGKIVRGGSTISMQLIRISRKGKPRVYVEKLIESIMAIGLECTHSKREILSLYSANAPFGGNVVGLNAASWRYFKRSPEDLSWAESATLAVLPNAPALIHPGRNRDALKLKRNSLLKDLYEEKIIDSIQYQLALLEPIPDEVVPMEQLAPHFLEFVNSKFSGKLTYSTIDIKKQQLLNSIMAQHAPTLKEFGVENGAALIVDTDTKEILAYAGNFSNQKMEIKDAFNDMIQAKRSTGSIMKPFLYAAMLDGGEILPNSLIRDIPSYFDNYFPQNYTNEFEGAVPASLALSKSLNVPAVYMLQEYGIGRFLILLKQLGFTSFKRNADFYGLTLILGGGEASLFELVGAYAGMAKVVVDYDKNYGKYPENPYQPLRYSINRKPEKENYYNNKVLHASSIWLTYNALRKVSRPDSETGWENFTSSSKIAWKTGTSHGFKDAWAIGSTADYVVGVWAGNATGLGRNGLSGTKSAAPIMFDIFNSLDLKSEFYPPYDEMNEIEVCKQSGYPASRYCSETEIITNGVQEKPVKVCSYHKHIFTDKNTEFRLSQECADISEMYAHNWFVLPPVQEHYYSKKHPAYRPLPPLKRDCGKADEENAMDFIYPTNNSSIYLAVDERNRRREAVFEISHNSQNAIVYWHLDNKLIGITQANHQLDYKPEIGKHTLTVVDQAGNYKSVKFNVLH
ncbi:MAG: penicillin-binding protein 1C [Marinilabiliales bacterium]|nr:MAG: penicillin-binding protein 1C [Marinilabiliales bacterium]